MPLGAVGDVIVVDVTVAVVVDAVAAGDGLVAGRAGQGLVVVAVAVERRVAVGVGVGRAVAVGIRGVVVERAVAVVVDAIHAHVVGDLVHLGVDELVGIVAVPAGGFVARGLLALDQGRGAVVAVAVAVHVVVPLGGRRGVQVAVVVVDQAVAVVVDAVALLGGRGVDGAVAVVAVVRVAGVAAGHAAVLGAGGGVALAVTVGVLVEGRGDPLVGAAVAVVVDTVAHLGGRGVDRAVGVVAVQEVDYVAGGLAALVGGARAVALAVAVGVRVVGGRDPLVHGAVAVVVLRVAVLGGARVGAGVVVVAVGAVAHVPAGGAAGAVRAAGVAEAVAVAVLVEGRLDPLVDVAVAVVVDLVAGLRGAGVHGAVAVVAVAGVRDVAAGLAAGHGPARAVALAVAVLVDVERRTRGGVHGAVVVVDVAIAVVVDAVAHLGSRGVDGAVAIVAVVGVADVAAGLAAGVVGGAAVALAVAVGVRVVGGLDPLVHGAVAVVVDQVAHLGLTGVGGRLGVVAVAGVRHVPAGGTAGVVRAAQVTVAVTVGVRVVGGLDPLVHGAVAVVVGLVADLRPARVDRGVGVVAVTVDAHVPARGRAADVGVRGLTVAVAVGVAVPGGGVGGGVRVDGAVAVVVRAVADLRATGVAGGVRVVAVAVVVHVAAGGVAGGHGRAGAVAEGVAVAVDVPVGGVRGGRRIDVAIAVVVHVVTDLGGRRVDGRLGVVAVRAVAHEARGGLAGRLGGVHVSVAVTVGVGVEGGRIAGVGAVGVAAAVVVDAVAADLGLAGVRGGLAVVAVGAVLDVAAGDLAREGGVVHVAVAVTVAIGVEGALHLLVGVAVAVVVQLVAELLGVRVDQRVAVLAVAALAHEAVGLLAGVLAGVGRADAVTVGVLVPGRRIVRVHVGGAVAVVVDVVADLGRVGVHRGVVIVAVTVRVHPQGLLTLFGQVAPVDQRDVAAEGVTVGVEVPQVVRGVVDHTVAVLIDVVADLVGGGVDGRVGVVAVIVVEHPAAAGLLADGLPDLGVAVAVTVAVLVPGVHLDVGVGVVAVALVLGEAVTVVVDVVGVGRGAVVVVRVHGAVIVVAHVLVGHLVGPTRGQSEPHQGQTQQIASHRSLLFVLLVSLPPHQRGLHTRPMAGRKNGMFMVVAWFRPTKWSEIKTQKYLN